MKSTELIEFLKTQPFTKDQAYNLVIEDLYDCPDITPESISGKVPQQLIAFFIYQIEEVLLPVISDLRQTKTDEITKRVVEVLRYVSDKLDGQDEDFLNEKTLQEV